MQIKKSYMVSYENGTSVWYAVDKEFSEDGIVSKEERPMLCADEGKTLKNKKDNYIIDKVWLKDTTEEDWEEISKEEADAIREEQEIRREIEIRRSFGKK